jgi:nucleoside-diphosphate-sugar epimerase
VLQANVRDDAQAKAALGNETFDAVVDFVAFTPEHVQQDIELFKGRTGQFIFISSASAYKKPVDFLPITESTPLFNPYWQYSRNKIACEELLMAAYRESGFPCTIVRPSHTYDKTLLPFDPYGAGYTVLQRLQQGKPVVVHGDGSSLWVLTHHRDFAHGFVGLLGNKKAVGEAFHITSDELLSWNQIFELIADAAGVDAQLVHVPSDAIAKVDPEWGAGLLGDKAHSVIFDNTKIKRLVPDFCPAIPFHQGAREIVSFITSTPTYHIPRPELDAVYDRLIERYSA